jgi:SAM-dependent methyltransferase
VVDESVNVLMTRSTLIYLHDKARTLREFFRVLRRGGRLSMFEPINSFAWPEHEGLFAGYDVDAVQDIAHRVRGCFGASTLIGWDERDVLAWLEAAGSRDVEMTHEIEVKPHPMAKTRDWDTFPQLRAEPAGADPAGGDRRAADAGGAGALRRASPSARRARRRLVPNGVRVRPRRQGLTRS